MAITRKVSSGIEITEARGDEDGHGLNILEQARLVERLFTTKFKELTAMRLDLPQRCLVYTDCSSNRYIFLL